MPYDVTSWFIDKAADHESEPVRCILIDGFDYCDHVTRWPSFTKRWDDIRPINFTINLSNADKTFNFFLEDKANFGLDVCLAMGFEGDDILKAADDFTSSYWQKYSGAKALTKNILTDISTTLFGLARHFFGENEHLGIPDGIDGVDVNLLDKLDKGLLFTNPDSGTAISTNSFTDGTSETSFVFRFKPHYSSTVSAYHPIWMTGADVSTYYQHRLILLNNHTMRWNMQNSAGSSTNVTMDCRSGQPGEFSANDIVHIGCVFDGAAPYYAMFFNGALTNSIGFGTEIQDPTRHPYNFFGMHRFASNEYFDADMTLLDVQFYNTALSENEINQLYINNSISKEPYLHLDFEESLLDISGNSNHIFSLDNMTEVYSTGGLNYGEEFVPNPYTFHGFVKRNTDNTSHYHLLRCTHLTENGSSGIMDLRMRSDVFTYSISARWSAVDANSGTWCKETLINSQEYYEFSLTPIWSADLTLNNSWQIDIYPAVGYEPWTYVFTTVGDIELAGLEYRRGAETIKLFEGTTDKTVYKDDLTIDITVHDKFKHLSERTVGLSDVPASFVGSNYLPSDIALWMVTSYGGYSAVQSTSNPDIDYEAFAEWSNVFSSNNVYIEAEFDGQKVTECLRKIGRMTHSGIYIERNKIVFKRFDALGVVVANINEDNVKICAVTVDDAVVINKQFVYADYSVASDYFQITPFFVDSESITIYGLREQIEEDENVWYVNTASALDLAQRLVSVHADPYTQIDLQSVLYLLPYTLGDNISTVSSFYGIEGSFRAMGKKIDMEKALVTMEIDRSQVTQGFQLDVSTWDNLIEALV